MENKGLLFIPDISGFTRFVNQMEIEHSRLIIQELLEIIINSNQIGLEISEIEGDAILFYKFGDPPGLEELYKQVATMFCEFHRNILAYEYRRFCRCNACNAVVDLTLKVITHYGEFADYQVKDFKKLIGKDIIVAHQLLKNDIDQHEYWLVTNTLMQQAQPVDGAQQLTWSSSVKQTESGEIPFRYAQLGELKIGMPPKPLPQLELLNKTKMISLSREYDAGIITLFHASGDFNYRNRWQEGIQRVEEVDPLLPRIGMRCRCISNDGEVIIYSTDYSYHPDRIEFSETDEAKQSCTQYLLEKTANNRTKLTLDFYIRKNFVTETAFRLLKQKKMLVTLEKSLVNLEELVKKIAVEGY